MKSTSPGVYMVLNILTNARYIGSTPRKISSRWSEHKCALRKNRHGNHNFQEAWNKDGENAFSLVILENTTGNHLEREQYWMDFYKEHGHVLYNLCPNSDSHKGHIMPKYVRRTMSEAQRIRRANMTADEKRAYSEKMREIFTEPAMVERMSRAVQEACRRRNLAKDPIYLRSPDGVVHTVYERYKFCLENELSPSAMSGVYNGKRRSHKGWTLAD